MHKTFESVVSRCLFLGRCGTSNLITLVNSLIRAAVYYACPVHGHVAKYSPKHLDVVVYNSILRFATGLPKWTPIFKLYRETYPAPLNFRRMYLISSFYIRFTTATNFNFPFPNVLPNDFHGPLNLMSSHLTCLLLSTVLRGA